MSVFEIFMLISFGAAWPVSIHKSITSKSIEGKSVIFLYVIIFGYMMGVIHKLLYHLDFVIFLYVLNLLMVLTDLLLYYRNKRLLAQED
jgi:hypothetical protein